MTASGDPVPGSATTLVYPTIERERSPPDSLGQPRVAGRALRGGRETGVIWTCCVHSSFRRSHPSSSHPPTPTSPCKKSASSCTHVHEPRAGTRPDQGDRNGTALQSCKKHRRLQMRFHLISDRPSHRRRDFAVRTTASMPPVLRSTECSRSSATRTSRIGSASRRCAVGGNPP